MAINWKLGDDGVLTIQGDGRMPDYGCGGRAMAPWSDEQSRIRHIFIGDGITEIGMRAFEGCENLQSVDLPETVVRIHARAFYGCKKLTKVHTAAKDTRICYLNSPGLRAWTEARRLEKLAREQAKAEKEKSLKEQKAKDEQEEEQTKTKEQAAAEQREKNGQVLLSVRKDKNGQTVLEVWKEKNGQLLEVRTGKYGQVVEVRKDANGRVLEVQRIKNGEVLKRREDRRKTTPEELTGAGERTAKKQGITDEKPVKGQKAAAAHAAGRQNSGAEASALPKTSVGLREIRFGLNSFYNVPWARQSFGDFYIANGVLYACLTGGKELTIPEGVHTLAGFAFKDTEAESISLPQSLVTIRAFAFADSKVQSLIMPDSVTNLENFAFADSRLTYLEFSERSRCRVSEGTFRNSLFRYKKCAEGLPDLFEVKAVQEGKKYGSYRVLRVAKKKVKTAMEARGEKIGIYGVPRIDVAKQLFRKMTSGSVLMMIHCEEGRITRLESFIWDKDEKLINEYLMFPCKDEDELSIYRDSFTWQEKEDFLYEFDKEDATFLEEQGILRSQDEDCLEQWFWSGDRGNFGGPLELYLLRYWYRAHDFRIDTEEDYWNRSRGISFVPI